MLDTMPRKTTRALISLRLNRVLLDRLDQYAEAVGRTRTELIDRAVEELLDRLAPRPVELPQQQPKGKRGR